MNSYTANKNQPVADAASKKHTGNQSANKFEDKRPEAVVQSKFQEMADNSAVGKNLTNFNNSVAPIQRRIHVGNQPVNPDNWRSATRITGSNPAHYGGGRFGIHAGVYNDNAANAPGAIAAAMPALGAGNNISDSSNSELLDRVDASDYTPEVDHIVEAQHFGSNSYSNARVLSKTENTNGVPARPVGAAIHTVAHHRIRIRNTNTGYNHVVAADTALNANDNAEIATFGGLGAVIGANSGAIQNNVRIDEF